MTKFTRRSALKMAAASTASLAMPRLALGQSDDRPEVTVAVQGISNSNTLEMLREQSNPGGRIFRNYVEPLIDTDWTGDMSMKPGLATSWKYIDDRTIEFELREGVKFHNGDILTAEDVAFSFGPDRMWGGGAVEVPEVVAAVARENMPGFERVEVVGPNRVRIYNTVPDVVLAGRMAQSFMVIANKRAFLEAGDWMEWARRPIGTGPYRIADYRPDQELILEAFDDHYQGRPPIRQLRFMEVPETASRINMLRSGGADFACDIPPDQIDAVESDGRYEVVGGPINNTRYLLLNASHPVLANPLVRRALTHSVDRQLIVDALWGGRTEVPRGMQWEFYGDYYIADHDNPAYDPDEARALLREAGYNGEPITYRIRNDYYTAQMATGQILVEGWRAVGLNIQLQVVETTAQVWDVPDEIRGINDWSAGASVPDPSIQAATWGRAGRPWRINNWRNEEFGDLCHELETSTDHPRRIAAWRRMLRIVEHEDPGYIVLHRNGNFTAKQADIRWRPSQSFVMDFGAQNWGS